jgi:APA family basic amino acid/polyamine antiporter
MAHKVHISRGDPGPASGPSGGERPQQFGLTAAMALIVGSIISVGTFNLPTSLAAYSPIALISMALTTVGTLALLSAALSRRLPADYGRTRMRASRSATAWGSRTPGRTGSTAWPSGNA